MAPKVVGYDAQGYPLDKNGYRLRKSAVGPRPKISGYDSAGYPLDKEGFRLRKKYGTQGAQPNTRGVLGKPGFGVGKGGMRNPLDPLALLGTAAGTIMSLRDQWSRGEGYAALPGLIGGAFQGDGRPRAKGGGQGNRNRTPPITFKESVDELLPDSPGAKTKAHRDLRAEQYRRLKSTPNSTDDTEDTPPVPTPTPPPRRDSDLDPTRVTPAPSDPNNTGAKGTQTGGFMRNPREFMGDLRTNLGINVINPFDSQPLPGSARGTSQSSPQEVGRGYISNADLKELDDIIANGPAEQTAFTQAEQKRAPLASGEDEELTVGEDGYYGGGISKRSRAFLDAPDGSGYNAVRAADATQGIFRMGDDFYMSRGNKEDDPAPFKLTRPQLSDIRNEKTTAQDLLSQFLQKVPDKAIDKAIQTGNPEDANPDSTSFDDGGPVVDLNPSVAAGGLMEKYKDLISYGGPYTGAQITVSEDTIPDSALQSPEAVTEYVNAIVNANPDTVLKDEKSRQEFMRISGMSDGT